MSNRLPGTRKATRTEEAATVGTPNWDQVTGWREAMIPALSTLEQLPDSELPWVGHQLCTS